MASFILVSDVWRTVGRQGKMHFSQLHQMCVKIHLSLMNRYNWTEGVTLDSCLEFHFQHLTAEVRFPHIHVLCGRWYQMYASLLIQCQSNHAWRLPLMYISMETSKCFLFIVSCRVGLATSFILQDHYIILTHSQPEKIVTSNGILLGRHKVRKEVWDCWRGNHHSRSHIVHRVD